MTEPEGPAVECEAQTPGPLSRVSLRHPSDLLSTAFGIGLVPVAPGTFGSLAAVPLAWWIAGAGGSIALIVAAGLVFVIGVRAAEITVRRTGTDDPGLIVIDEVAAQMLVLAAVPLDPAWYAAGFAAFRLFDIIKIWPVSWVDRHVHGGLGVMLDDVAAAGYAIACLLLARLLMGDPGG